MVWHFGFLGLNSDMVVFPENIAPSVHAVIKTYPEPAQKYLINLRCHIFEIAEANAEIGIIEETLKWGEPTYLTTRPKSGTPLRLAWKAKRADKIGLFVNSQTRLIQTFREIFSDALDFDGNRVIWLDLNTPAPEKILSICIEKTLTYYLN